jgi:hypothetical protein
MFLFYLDCDTGRGFREVKPAESDPVPYFFRNVLDRAIAHLVADLGDKELRHVE